MIGITNENGDRRIGLSHRQAWTVLIVLGGLGAARATKSVNAWVLTHWTFSYQHGFLKRALVGDLVARIFGPPTVALVTALSVAIALVAAAALLRCFVEPALRERSTGAWLFAVTAVTHSATIPNLVYDLGRFDHIGLVILLGCLAVLACGAPMLRLIIIPLACAVGLVVHEAFFVMFLPLILAVWHYEEAGERRAARIVVLVGLIALTWAITSFGKMTAMPMAQYVAELEARHTFSIRASSVLVLYTDSGQNLANTMPGLLRRWQVTNHFVLFLTLLPSLILFGRLALALGGARVGSREGEDRREGATDRRRWLVLGASLTPLLLYGLGVDVARWWAITITNFLVALSYLAIRERATFKLADAVGRMPAVALVVIGVSLAAGPLGMIQGYPLFEGLWFVSTLFFDSIWSVIDSAL